MAKAAIGRSSECFRMTAGVRSGKAQNERMFFRFGPQSGHRELSSMCPLGAVRALRAGAHGLGASDLRRDLRSYERDCAATANARGGGILVAAITRRASAASSAKASMAGGVTCSGKALVSQCAPEAPIGVTFRQKALRYQRTAQTVLNRGGKFLSALEHSA